MKELSTRHAYITSVAAGSLLWLVTASASGRNEAWDSEWYWTAAYPLAIVLAGILGYLAPVKPWRWGLIIMLTQAAVLAITASSFGLLPLGLILFAILAMPPIGVASITAWLRNRWREH